MGRDVNEGRHGGSRRRKKVDTAAGKTWDYMPHAHLLALGTVERTRRRIGGRFARYDSAAKSKGTGRMTPSHAVPRGVGASQAAVLQAMIDTAKRELAKGVK